MSHRHTENMEQPNTLPIDPNAPMPVGLHAVVRHVKQEDAYGCGIACAAMMCESDRITYQFVKTVWKKHCNGDEQRLTQGGGLRYTEIIDLLHLLGARMVPNVAPTFVQITKNGNGHFVVIDRQGRILDPSA